MDLRFLQRTAVISLALSLVACNAAAATPSPSPTTRATPRPRNAVLSEWKNEVQARESKDEDWQAPVVGDSIPVGGGVQTGEEARARLDISDGAIVRLSANTLFELANLSPEPTDSQTQWSLLDGKIWTFVSEALGAGSFEVNTPVGNATVRGSYMSAEYYPEDGHLVVTCLEGRCTLTSTAGQSVDLVSGQQAEIPGFGQDPSPPQPIDSVELADWTANFPEAVSIAAAITPGPPPSLTPTLTPTPTPTPTATPTLSPSGSFAFPSVVQLAELPSSLADVDLDGSPDMGRLETFSGEYDAPRVAALYPPLLYASVGRLDQLGFEAAYLNAYLNPADPCNDVCSVYSWAFVFESNAGADAWLLSFEKDVNANLKDVQDLYRGETAYYELYLLVGYDAFAIRGNVPDDALGREIIYYVWRERRTVIVLAIQALPDTVSADEVQALAKAILSHER